MKYKTATTTAASMRIIRSVVPTFCFKVCLNLCDNEKEGIHTVRCLNREKDSTGFRPGKSEAGVATLGKPVPRELGSRGFGIVGRAHDQPVAEIKARLQRTKSNLLLGSSAPEV